MCNKETFVPLGSLPPTPMLSKCPKPKSNLRQQQQQQGLVLGTDSIVLGSPTHAKEQNPAGDALTDAVRSNTCTRRRLGAESGKHRSPLLRSSWCQRRRRTEEAKAKPEKRKEGMRHPDSRTTPPRWQHRRGGAFLSHAPSTARDRHTGTRRVRVCCGRGAA